MPITPVGLFRGIFLAFGMAALLSGTVLFPFVRRLMLWWVQMGDRFAGPRASGRSGVLTRAVAQDALLRGWQLVCAAVGFILWWYLGTAHGAAWLASVLRPR